MAIPSGPRANLFLTRSGLRSGALATCLSLGALTTPSWAALQVEDPSDKNSAKAVRESKEPGETVALDLDTLVVTPTLRPATILDVPFTVDRITEERLSTFRTFPEALRDVPGVLTQSTGVAQGSPYIRGFTGFRTLLLIDGIRVNNSVFRDGPNQYAGTIDPLGLQAVEVVKGPSSVLYGSDAIGGTMQALTKSPTIWDRPVGGEIYMRAADAANYVITRAELGGVIGSDTAWHLGGTIKDFGNTEAGYPSGELPNTSYDEWDGDFKLEHRLDPLSKLTFAVNRVEIDDAPRTHRTVDAVPFNGSSVGSDLRHDFDQTRTLAYLRLDTAAAASGDWETQSTLSYHRQEELRQRERSGGRFDDSGFDVGTIGLQLRASRDTSFGALTVGAEWYRDSVDSFLDRFGDQTPADGIQGPVADDATYDLGGLFAETAWDLASHTTLTAGARATYAAADANEVRDPVTDSQVSIDEDWAALTGSLRFETRLIDDGKRTVALFGGVSQGFRAPNLSDLSRFDAARTDEFEIPSPGLDPERYLAYEIGLKHESKDLSLQFSTFLTEGDDIIQRFPTGQVNADGDVEITKENVGSSTIGGAEIGAAYRFAPEWTVFGNAAFLDGQEETRAGLGEPVIEAVPTRLMPFMSQLGFRFVPDGTPWIFEARWLHSNKADRLSPGDLRDDSRIPPGGTPGYEVFDLFASYRFSEAFRMTFSIENLLDEDYRVHGSGQNQPGRNAVVSARWSF
ncbi:TonB-dependent receptor [Saltatorellus ferox]|uniref:TonB-dependent receptor n=1 Tax=Saltatorellus ferox TaxID=2528018 RepID=UPI003AF353E6